MTPEDWRRFLDSLEAAWLERLDSADLEQLPTGDRSPATEAELQEAEARLGLRFPPSYRTFLSVTNGYGATSPFIDRLFTTAEVERFGTLNPDWIDAYGGGDELTSLIQISDVGDSAVLLLNPAVVTDGEWEAWFWATWGPDEERHASFAELMRAQHAALEQLVPARPLAAKELDAAVKRARTSALGGEVGAPQRVLTAAAGAGHRTARILLVQLLAFQHRWDDLIPHVLSVLAAPWEGPGNAKWEDLFPALARAASETGRWEEAIDAVDGLPPGQRILDAMLRDGGIDAAFPDFPNDAFDAAVRRAKELARSGRGDDAFAVLLDAMPQWFSFRLDNLAPTALIADRDLGPLITADRGRALLAVRRDVRQP